MTRNGYGRIPKIKNQQNQRIPYWLRNGWHFEPVTQPQQIGFELLEDGLVQVGNNEPRRQGCGRIPHLNFGHEATYLLTHPANGGTQFDVFMYEEDAYGEFSHTRVFDPETDEWLRVEYTDIGERHHRARSIGRIPIESLQTKRERVAFEPNGTLELLPNVHVTTDGVVGHINETTGEDQIYLRGTIRTPGMQVNVHEVGSGTQIDLFPLPDDIFNHETYVVEDEACYRIQYAWEEEIRRPHLFIRLMLFFIGFMWRKPPELPIRSLLEWLPRQGAERVGLDRGERAESLVPLGEEIAPYAWVLVNSQLNAEEFPPFQIGGIPFPDKVLTEGFIAVGVPGTGKSVTLKQLFITATVFRRDPDFVAVVTNDKDDFQNLIQETDPDIEYFDLNPFNEGAYAFRLDTVLNHQGMIEEFAKLFVRVSPDEFWTSNAMEGITIIMLWFLARGGVFTLRDVYLAATDPEIFVHIANQTYAGQNFLKRNGPPKQRSGILAHLANSQRTLKFAADASYIHEQAGRVLCLHQFMERQTDARVLLLGADKDADESLKAYNQLIVMILTKLALQGPQVDRPRTVFFVDEMLSFTDVPLSQFAEQGRTYGAAIWGCTQHFDDLVQKVSKSQDSTWPELLLTKIFFRCGLRDAKSWAAELFGKAYRLARSWSHQRSVTDTFGASSSRGPGPQGGASVGYSQSTAFGETHGVTLSLELTDAVPQHCFSTDLELPNTSDYIVGFLMTDPAIGGGLAKFRLHRSTWPAKSSSEGVEKLDKRTIHTVPWNATERQHWLACNPNTPPRIEHDETNQLLREASIYIPGETLERE